MASTIVTSIPWRDKVLGHLQPDEPGTDHDRRLRRGTDVGGQAGGVLDGPKGASTVITGDRRPHRSGAHAEYELVVGV